MDVTAPAPTPAKAGPALIAGRLVRSKLPERHRDATVDLSGPFGSVLEDARAAIAKGAIIAIIGGRGTGKTQLAAELIRDACATCTDRTEPAYRTAFRLFAEIRATMRNDAKESDLALIDRFTRASLLVIDEAHERGETSWEDRTLTALIDARYGAKVGTVLIANVAPDKFAEALRESVVSRITESGGVIVCDWPSRRGA